MEILLVVLIAFTVSYVIGEALARIKMPKVLAPLLVGFMMGLPYIKPFLLPADSMRNLAAFADVALVFIMFFVGLEIDFTSFKGSMLRSTHVAFWSAAIPFVLGYLTVRYLGYPPLVAIVIGACLSITAEAISIDILQELGMLKTKIGQIILEAGILDDVAEIMLIAVVVTYAKSGQVDPATGIVTILFEVFSFVLAVYILRYLVVPKIMVYIEKKNSKTDLFVTFLIIALLMAVTSSFLGMGAVIGALAAGMLIRHSFFQPGSRKYRTEESIIEIVEIITFGLLAPFFFIWVGANVDFFQLQHVTKLGIAITVVAFIGKLSGSLIGNWLGKGSLKEGIAIGWGMNARGAVELVAAKIAMESGLIGPEIFSALVLMTFITTVISPIMFKRTVQKYHIRREEPFSKIISVFKMGRKTFEDTKNNR